MSRIGARLPGVSGGLFEDEVIISDPTGKLGSLIIYGGKAGNKALTIKDGSTDFLTIDPDNSITTGEHIKITATPETSSVASVMSLEGKGSNWSSGSSVLNLYSLDADLNILRFYSSSTLKGKLERDGTLSTAGSLILSGSSYIKTTGNRDLILLPDGTGITVIGDASSTSHSLAANDDLFVTGKLEVDGPTYFDHNVYHASSVRFDDDRSLILGDDSDFRMEWNIAQATSGALMFGLGVYSRYMILTDLTHIAKNHDHGNQSHPTLFIHATIDPDTDNTPWISFSHDSTDGDINCGKGTLNLSSAAGVVNFKTATYTGSTVTHDAYVELEVAGVMRKFMLGS